MPDTTRRVNVTLTFATDDEPADVAYSVMAVVHDESRHAHGLEAVNVHAFDLAEGDEPEAEVHLVVSGGHSLVGTYVNDYDSAVKHARRVSGVVATLPVSADHRGEVAP